MAIVEKSYIPGVAAAFCSSWFLLSFSEAHLSSGSFRIICLSPSHEISNIIRAIVLLKFFVIHGEEPSIASQPFASLWLSSLLYLTHLSSSLFGYHGFLE